MKRQKPLPFLCLSIFLTAFLMLSCSQPKDKQTVSTAKGIVFALQAKNQNPENVGEADTLLFAIKGTAYQLSPEGLLSWGKDRKDTIQITLNPGEYLVNKAYYYPLDENRLLIAYEDTDGDAGGASIVVANTRAKKVEWRLNGLSFNLCPPYITKDHKYAYISSLGTVGKINLETGEQVFLLYDLYGSEQEAMVGGADTILFRGDSTLFIAKYESTYHRGFSTIDTIIFKEGTREIVYRILRPIDSTQMIQGALFGAGR